MTPELKSAIDAIISAKSQMATREGRAGMDMLMKKAMSLAVTPEDKAEAGRYLSDSLHTQKRTDVKTKQLLEECSEMINLSFIARRYFNKDRSWLSQRINGSIVNGKQAAFTENELRIFSESLADIGSIISKTSLSIQNSL